MSKWADPVNKLIKIMLDLADLADEKQETPFDSEMGLGCYAFSGYIRKGIKEIIDLKSQYYSAKESAERAKAALSDNEELLRAIFGTSDIVDYQLTEEEIGRIKAVVRDIEKSWEKVEHTL